MENVYVVFDTNAYRTLTYGLTEFEVKAKFKAIKEAESKKDIRPILSHVTGMELLAHLADLCDPGFGPCKIASIAAGYHCLTKENKLPYLAHPQILLQNLIFGDVDEPTAKQFEVVIELINLLATKPASQIIDTYPEQLNAIEAIVKKHESDFKETISKFVKGIDPTAKSWTAFENDRDKRKRVLGLLSTYKQYVIAMLALGYVNKTLNSRKLILPDEGIRQKLATVVNTFKAPMVLHAAVISKIIVGGFDMDNSKMNRANTIWDIYHLFSVSHTKFNELDLIFVTAEKWLHNIAEESGLHDKVVHIETYLSNINV